MSNRRGDDGSQEWFDGIQRQRMQQRRVPNQKNGQSYLDQRVGSLNQQQRDPAEINDPYIKNIVNGYKTQPHYGPAHMGGQAADKTMESNYEVEVDMPAMQNQIMQKMMDSQRQSGGQSFTVEEELMKLPPHLRQQFMPLAQGQMPHQAQQQQQQAQSVTLKEGYPLYRPLQQSFGNMLTLAREIGLINGQLASQHFIVKGPKNVYIIPQNQNSVNIQEIQNNPRLMTQLVELRAPPMTSLGPLFVLQESITGQSQYPGGKQIITDGRQLNYQQTQAFSNNNGRNILKG